MLYGGWYMLYDGLICALWWLVYALWWFDMYFMVVWYKLYGC